MLKLTALSPEDIWKQGDRCCASRSWEEKFFGKSNDIVLNSDIISTMSKKKHKQMNPAQVIISANHPNPPEQHEVEAAHILAQHFKCTVAFLTPIDDYKRKTADIVMQGVLWEIKSPIGTSKSTIGNQFRVASKQARNIVIDTRRTSLEYDSIEKAVLFELKNRPSVKRVILIDKNDKVLAFQK